MTQHVVFEEPAVPRTTPLGSTEPAVNWLLESTRREVVEGRRLVNHLYARFPDHDGGVRQRLRSTNQADLMTALDELLVHDLLSRKYRVEYEEGDEGTRPDFRLYDESGYVAAVEVASLFLRGDWARERRRHGQIEDELNKRLKVTSHFVDFEVRRWDSQPSVRRLVCWLERALEELRADPHALPVGDLGLPEKVYHGRTAELVFSFDSVPDRCAVKASDRIVTGGAGLGGWLDSAVRLRERLDGKAGKYELGGKPYAIVVGVRDEMCDLNEVFDALTGTPAVVIATGQGTRKDDGFYGRRTRGGPDGKRPAVSCVYAIQDWWPGGPYRPRITRFDNPFAQAEFPLDAMPLDGHWAVVDRGPTHVRSDWRILPAPQSPVVGPRASAGQDRP